MARNRKPKGLDGIKVTSCEVVHKDAEGSIVVRKEDGGTKAMSTGLPEVNKGSSGKIVEIDGIRAFIREPYPY